MNIVLRWYDRDNRAAFRDDGHWIDVKEGTSGVEYGVAGHQAIATPTPFVETREDGARAQVWAVRPR